MQGACFGPKGSKLIQDSLRNAKVADFDPPARKSRYDKDVLVQIISRHYLREDFLIAKT
jgi:hypothetical protein